MADRERLTASAAILVAIVIVLGFVFVSLFSLSEEQDEVIKIGCIAPLTGPFAKWGESIKNGLELAVKDTKHKFIVSYEDSVCQPETTVTIANKFFDVDGIKLIIGPGCVTGLRAIAPMGEEKGALLFSTGLLDDEIFDEYDNVINLAAQISTEAKHISAYMHSEGISRIAIIHGTNYFGQEFGKQLSRLLEAYKINVTSTQPTALDLLDFRTVILKIMETGPEAIFIHQAETQIGIFLKQLRELGYESPVYTYYAAEQESVVQAAGEALEGVKYTYPFNGAEGSEEKKGFETRYKSEFGGEIPSATSFFVYDGIMLLDEAMDICKPDDTDCISEFFKESGQHQGLSGNFSFKEDGSIFRPFGIKTVKDGEFIWLMEKIDTEQ